MVEHNIVPFPRAVSHVIREGGAIVADNLHLARDGTQLLMGASMRLSPRGVSAIMGPNGAGKSTLLRVIAGLIEPDEGKVEMPRQYRSGTSVVFQRPVLLRRSVRGNLAHALRVARLPKKERAARLNELLRLGKLMPHAARPARLVSGGEQQRLAIARALASDPALVLMDEPTAHFDPASTLAIELLIRAIASEGVKVVMVTHDPQQAARLASEIAFLHNGRITEVTPAQDFFAAPSSEAAEAYLAGHLLL